MPTVRTEKLAEAQRVSACLQVDASPTRRYGGSGLGLAISQKLCEAMGGAMWAASDGLGCGSTFRWTLAARAPPPAAVRRSVDRVARTWALPTNVRPLTGMASAVNAIVRVTVQST